MKKFPITLTSELTTDGQWRPFHASDIDIHVRIYYRGLKTGYHIGEVYQPIPLTFTRAQRQNNYEVKCLEKGIRPHNYSDADWNTFLSDYNNEYHSNTCENRNAWRYQY